jgi:hypothetical protein
LAGSSFTSPSTITPDVAFAKVMPSEKKCSAITFLKAALAYYESLVSRSSA